MNPFSTKIKKKPYSSIQLLRRELSVFYGVPWPPLIFNSFDILAAGVLALLPVVAQECLTTWLGQVPLSFVHRHCPISSLLMSSFIRQIISRNHTIRMAGGARRVKASKMTRFQRCPRKVRNFCVRIPSKLLLSGMVAHRNTTVLRSHRRHALGV